jgi:plasminogen activator
MAHRSPSLGARLLACAAALLATATVLISDPAQAFHASNPGGGSYLAQDGAVSFSLEASVGMASGTATELAFDYPLGSKYKRSELTWDLKDVWMGGVQSSVGYGRRVRLNLGYWAKFSDGSGGMVDRDWLYADAWTPYFTPSGSNWTDESRHPDTTVDKGSVLDVNLSVLALESGRFSLSGILGYKRDTWGWSSRGGTYVYSDESLRDTSGSFPAGATVITYEQEFTVPYLGVGAAWTLPAVRVEAHALLSGAVSATDTDHHVLRGQTFSGDFSGGSYIGLGLNAVWAFAPRWAATFGLEYQSIPEITGDVTSSGAEGEDRYGAGGGLSMEAVMASFGVGCRF